jgi:hypothetical protein
MKRELDPQKPLDPKRGIPVLTTLSPEVPLMLETLRVGRITVSFREEWLTATLKDGTRVEVTRAVGGTDLYFTFPEDHPAGDEPYVVDLNAVVQAAINWIVLDTKPPAEEPPAEAG